MYTNINKKLTKTELTMHNTSQHKQTKKNRNKWKSCEYPTYNPITTACQSKFSAATFSCFTANKCN